MIKRVDLIPRHEQVFGNPAPLGLMGLAVACFALVPLSFGLRPTPEVLLSAAIFCFFFGGCCQLLTGLMDFANKNAFGGSVFTLFAFGWLKNALVFFLAWRGIGISHELEFVADLTLLCLLGVLTYGFGFFSKTLFLLLLDIDLLYAAKIVNYLTHSRVMDVPLGVLTLLLGLIALWIALAALTNPVVGRALFPETGPVFSARRKTLFDFAARFNLFGVLYEQWRESAYTPLPIAELQRRVQEKIGEQNILPDLFYLQEYGCLALTFRDAEQTQVAGARLTSDGIDLYEQLILKKYEF